MTPPWVIGWAEAFVLTQLVEAPLYTVRIVRAPGFDGRGRYARSLVLALGASAMTHPAVWFVFPMVVQGSYWTMIGLAELFAVTVEALYLWALSVPRAILWSLVANALSVGAGLLLRFATS